MNTSGVGEFLSLPAAPDCLSDQTDDLKLYTVFLFSWRSLCALSSVACCFGFMRVCCKMPVCDSHYTVPSGTHHPENRSMATYHRRTSANHNVIPCEKPEVWSPCFSHRLKHSNKVKHWLIVKHNNFQINNGAHSLMVIRAQELCESRSCQLPVPNSPYGLCGHKATLNLNF